MKKGDTVRIISDLYGDNGKAGTVVDVMESDQMGVLVSVKSDNKVNTYTINDVLNITASLNVKESVNLDWNGFIEDTPITVNKDAAYKRKTIMDEIIELWHTEINATDTAGLSEEHRAVYDTAFEAMNAVIEQELKVICDGR